MLQKSLFAVALLLLLSCEESLPPIDFSQSNGEEWVYSEKQESEIPAKQNKVIVIEDLTGVRCSNCPKAAETAKNIKDAHPDRTVVIGIYPLEPKNLTTPYNNYPDLRTDGSQLIASNLFGFSNQLPGGGVNRRLFDGNTSLNIPYNTWVNSANKILPETAPVNLELSVSKETEKEYLLRTDLTFTSAVEFDPFITILLLENNIAHPQTTPTGSDQSYIHQHVLRALYTPYNGAPVFNSSTTLIAKRGTSAVKTWTISIPDFVNTSEASLVAMINYNDSGNKEVIQCKEIKLK